MRVYATFLLTIIVIGIGVMSCVNTSVSNADKTKFGPGQRTSLIVFFNKNTTHEQIEKFYNETISIARPDGTYSLARGVALQFQVRNGDYEGVGMTFAADATPEERTQLKTVINSSPIVYKIYENVVANEIKDL